MSIVVASTRDSQQSHASRDRTPFTFSAWNQPSTSMESATSAGLTPGTGNVHPIDAGLVQDGHSSSNLVNRLAMYFANVSRSAG